MKVKRNVSIDITGTPIETASFGKIGDVFSEFDGTTRNLFMSLQSVKGMLPAYSYDEVLDYIDSHPDNPDYDYPKFMRYFMGSGILSSTMLATKLATRDNREGSSRVGAADSDFHNHLKTYAKKCAIIFNPAVETLPQELQEMLKFFDAVSKIDIAPDNQKIKVWKEEGFEGEDLTAAINSDKMKQIDALERPECLVGLNYQQMVDKLSRSFLAMESVVLFKATEDPKKNPQFITVDNKKISWSRKDISGETPEITEFSSSLSAIAYGIAHAGHGINTRPPESPMRKFLENHIGVGQDAGNKTAWLRETHPEIYPDCNREGMAEAIAKQRYWIRTARACAMIQDKNGGGFAKVLELIGKDPDKITFESASKIAVLLYATSEVLEKKVPEINKEMITAIRTLAAEMYRLSEATEKDLTEAKRKARMNALEGVTPENETKIRTEHYKELKDVIIAKQREGLKPLMGDEKNMAIIKAFAGVVDKNIGIFPGKAKQYVIHAKEYCTEWVGTATSPITGAVSGLQEGRKAGAPKTELQ